MPRGRRRPPAVHAPLRLRTKRAAVAPELRTGLVYRAGVVNRLRVERAPVVSLTAPPGYGKTTVLAQWARRDTREFRWLRFERGDDESRVFPALLVASLAADDGGDARKGRSAAARVRSALRARTEPLVIVLDNVEQISAPESLDLLASLVEHLAPATQLVVAGRQPPSPLLGRVRAEGRLTELSAADLCLSDREAQALLHGTGVELTLEEAKEVNRHAEGWPTGVYLGGLALATRLGDVPRRAHDLRRRAPLHLGVLRVGGAEPPRSANHRLRPPGVAARPDVRPGVRRRRGGAEGRDPAQGARRGRRLSHPARPGTNDVQVPPLLPGHAAPEAHA